GGHHRLSALALRHPGRSLARRRLRYPQRQGGARARHPDAGHHRARAVRRAQGVAMPLALRMPVAAPPSPAKFTLRGPLDAEQRDFLDTYGYIHFGAFATPSEIAMIRDELGRIEAAWLAEDRQVVNGIPIRYGTRPDGSRYVNRFAFTSLFSARLREFLADERWEAVRAACGDKFRLGQHEKDGVVVNQFIN